MSWEAMETSVKESGTSGDFIKLKAGESIRLVLRGEPYLFFQKFKDRVEYTEYVEGSSRKFHINAIVKDGDNYKAKILQGGVKLMSAILACKSKYGLDCIYELQRQGATQQDTRYNLLYDSKLEGEALSQVNAVPLLSLSKGRSQQPDAHNEDRGEPRIPF